MTLCHDPYVYFTYFSTTEEAFNDPLNPTARDSFRVFVADEAARTCEDSGTWLPRTNPPKPGSAHSMLIRWTTS